MQIIHSTKRAAMPILIDPRQEAMAQAMARGMKKTPAGLKAGYKRGGRIGEVAKLEHVVARINELEPTLRWSGTRDVTPVIDELAQAALLAIKKGIEEESAPWLKAGGDLMRVLADLKQRLPEEFDLEPPPKPPMTTEEWVRKHKPAS
jgi:hypothetical protein